MKFTNVAISLLLALCILMGIVVALNRRELATYRPEIDIIKAEKQILQAHETILELRAKKKELCSTLGSGMSLSMVGIC